MIADHLDIRIHVVTRQDNHTLVHAKDRDDKITSFHGINVESGVTDWDGGITMMVLTADDSIYFMQAGLEGDDVNPEDYTPLIYDELLKRIQGRVQAIGIRIGAWAYKEAEGEELERWECRHQFLVTPEGDLDAVTTSARNPEKGLAPDHTQPLWEFAETAPSTVDMCNELRRFTVRHNTTHEEQGKEP